MELKSWQAKVVWDTLRPGLRYLGRVRGRLEKVGFVQDDRLYQLVCKAYDSIHALCVELYYEACKSGVGRPRKEN